MALLLDFERYQSQLHAQLLRRIGYTNGLHKIRRFSRVVEYVYANMPASVRLLSRVIIEEENKRFSPNERQLSGTKYAVGIVDVAGALGLLEKFGPKIALSSEGYGCHALNMQKAPSSVMDAFLLERVIEADGEYALNVLRIVQEGTTDVLDVGERLIRAFEGLIAYKREWARQAADRYSQKTIEGLLSDAARTLKAATEKAGADLFLKHTVKPRLEWLEDLGCVRRTGVDLEISPVGERLLTAIREAGGWKEFGIVLPLATWLADQLGLSNLYEGDDLAWRLVAACFRRAGQLQEARYSAGQLMDRIHQIYRDVKLANFNEADVRSIYEVLAAYEAAEGRTLSEAELSRSISRLVSKFPDKIFRLSKRRGHGMYIALKDAK